MFHEYPKSLHLNGDRNDAHVIVADVAEEAGLRADGYRMIGEAADEAGEPVKPLDKMTKAELAAHARDALGLDLDPAAMKARDMIEAISAAAPDAPAA